MVRPRIELRQPRRSAHSATCGYLESRLREEADAGARAGFVEAALAHAMLATRYAECLAECSSQRAIAAGQSWVQEHRVW
jgi:hypothetical protein